MTNKNKIQEWSGKRVDDGGQEYQIDTVFNEVRFIIIEGRYHVEHNAVEVNRKCGHVTVVTDEYVNDVWNDGKSREGTIRELENSLCPKCRNERINKKLDENENLAHLMPSDSPASY